MASSTFMGRTADMTTAFSLPRKADRFRDAILARLRAFHDALGGMTASHECAVEEMLQHVVTDDSLTSTERAIVLLTGVTGRYPTEAQVLDLQPWIAVGSGESVARVLRRALRRTPRRSLARVPVHAPYLLVDVTRTSRAVSMTGIPRVASQVAHRAEDIGGAAVVWADGVPGIIELGNTGVTSFAHPGRSAHSAVARGALLLKKAYWSVLTAVSRTALGYRLASATRTALSPLGAHLFNRYGPSQIPILVDCRYVLPEVALTDTSARLLPWMSVASTMHTVIAVHDLLPVNSPRFFQPDQRLEHIEFSRVVAHADEVVVSSPHLVPEIEGLRAVFGSAAPTRLELIPYGGGTGADGPDRRQLITRHEFLMIGSMDPRKNHALVLRALGRLALDGHITTLNLVGAHRPPSPDTRAALEYARSAGVQVVQHGSLDDTRVGEIADRCAALFYPSFNEGYGLPVLEALSMAMPVIASDIPSNRAHTPLGGVVLVPADEPAALATTVLRVMDDDDYYAGLLDSIDAGAVPIGFDAWVREMLGSTAALSDARLEP